MDPPTDSETIRNDIAKTYGKAIGEILYIADSTLPYIAYATTALARTLKNPTQRHWSFAQGLVQDLRSTRNEGILMPANNKRAVQVNAYWDADYANDQSTRKSITGILTTVNGAPVQWLAKQQPVVGKSTFEAEYIAAAESTTVTLWLHNLLKEARIPTSSPTLPLDNTVAVQMANNTGATR